MNLCEFMQVWASLCKSAQVYASLREFTQVCASLRESTRVCASLCESARVYASLCESVQDYLNKRPTTLMLAILLKKWQKLTDSRISPLYSSKMSSSFQINFGISPMNILVNQIGYQDESWKLHVKNVREDAMVTWQVCGKSLTSGVKNIFAPLKVV